MTRVLRLLRLAAVVTLLGAWVVFLRPTNLGGSTTYLLVRGTSMLPTYPDGDLLILGAAESYTIGEAVAYRVPEGDIGAGHLVIHRIVGGSAAAGWDLQGDNNNAVDPWHPHGSDVVGTVRLAIPALGKLLGFLHQPVTLAALAAALVMGWMVMSNPGSRRREEVPARP